MSEEQTTQAAAGRARPSDGLSLADLRDAVRLRQDLTRLEDENRLLRAQLARAQEPAPALQSPPAADPVPDAPPPPAARPPAETPAPVGPPGLWSRLWRSVSD